MVDGGKLPQRIAFEQQHRAIGNGLHRNRINVAQRRAHFQPDAGGKFLMRMSHRSGTVRRRENFHRLARNIDHGLVLADHGKAAVQRPQAPVDAIQNPHAATGRGRHIERNKVDLCRPREPPRRAAMKQIEHQESLWLDQPHHQKMQFGHRQAAEGKRLRRSRRRHHPEISILRAGGACAFILCRPEVRGDAGPGGVHQQFVA